MKKKTRKNRRFNNIYKRINSETARNLNSGGHGGGPIVYMYNLILSHVEFIGPDRYCGTHALAQYVGGIIMTDIACPPSPFYRPRFSFRSRATNTRL